MPEPELRNSIRAWRVLRGYSQEHLGECVGTTGAVISLLETGHRPLSEKWLRGLAAALGTTPCALLGGGPQEVAAPVLDLWSAIPEELRPHALRLLESFAKRA